MRQDAAEQAFAAVIETQKAQQQQINMLSSAIEEIIRRIDPAEARRTDVIMRKNQVAERRKAAAVAKKKRKA